MKVFMKFLMNQLLGLLLGKLKQFALDAVYIVKINGFKDEAARKEVIRQIKEEAKKDAIDLKDSAINLAIELAVNYSKK